LGTNDTAGTINAPTIAFGAGTGVINFNQSDSTTVSAAISGAGSVNQLGTGTTILSASNSYTGATTVAAGSMIVDGQISLSDVTILAGAALGGDGILGGNLTLEAGAKFVFSLTSTLDVNGTSVSFGDFGIDDLVGLDGSTPDGIYTIIGGSASVNTNNLSNLGSANAFDIGGGKQAYFSTGSLNVNVVPEPSTYALLAVAAVGCGARLLRRRLRRKVS